MRVDNICLKKNYLQKEAPARFDTCILCGGADINEGYVLGLRFKPDPVFHFLGMWETALRKEALSTQGLPHAGNARAYGRYGVTAAVGGTFDE